MYSQANVRAGKVLRPPPRALPSVIVDTEKVLREADGSVKLVVVRTAHGWKFVRPVVRLKNRTVRAGRSRRTQAYTQVKMEDAHKLLKIPKSECPDIWIRLPRHKWPKSWSSMEDPVVPLERNLFGHSLAGLLWERQFEKIQLKHGWEKVPNWECLCVHRQKVLFLSLYVDDIKLAGWSYDMTGHAKKCVQRYCELANKTTQQLYKVSTPCIDDHHFKEEEIKSVGKLSQVCSQIVLKCLHLARIGRADILWSVNKTCTIDQKMDQGL